jgi:hypothetical protein
MIGACPTNCHEYQQVDNKKLFHACILIFNEFASTVKKITLNNNPFSKP